MAWHNFKAGKRYPTREVVDVCNRYIDSGTPVNQGEKRRHLDIIRSCGREYIVFRPISPRGWGASPMNQNCWIDDDDRPISQKVRVPRNV